MKALTLHQPWASLIALGVKTIETRSWSTKYRGPLLVHAGMRMVEPATVGDWIVHRTIAVVPWMIGPDALEHGTHDLPLGAIVASCTLADVVPILAADQDPCPGGNDWVKHVAPVRPLGDLALWDGPTYPENLSTGRPTWTITDIEDQRPYGDFTPGRFAWLLEDIQPTTERCPACWGEGGFLCEPGPITGSPEVEWSPLFRESWEAPVRLDCSSCAGGGRCDPIPAKGKQGLWDWAP